MNNIKRVLSLALLLGFLPLTGCNTIEGAGKDLEKAGEEVQEEAHEEKND